MKFYICAGKLKNLPLAWNADSTTRPTKSILRESFFNSLGAEIVQSVFVEGFAGCGSMGIEALSRGAQSAVFFEINAKAYRILETNLKAAQKRVMGLNFQSYNTDFFCAFETKLQMLSAPVILYLDPPFCIREGMQDIYERCFKLVEELASDKVRFVIFEHWSEYEMPLRLGDFELSKKRQFGKSSLTYYVVKE